MKESQLTVSPSHYLPPALSTSLSGGGPTGQAGAARHGIARALLTVDANLRPVLKAEGLLTRDPRMNNSTGASMNPSGYGGGAPPNA